MCQTNIVYQTNIAGVLTFFTEASHPVGMVCLMARQAKGFAAPQLIPDTRPDAFSIRELYDSVDAALSRAFPKGGQLWVRGEIQSISDRTGHCYMDLVDPDAGRGRDAPVLKVNCWGRTWGPLKATLTRQ
ncbi:MAG TPA: exodeoxyribonuclease VII large subunit, partial [Acidimicrobiales bacterium]|nr:exodeoxyribonuclease VII large subunit [Acidimicrobiales bacterium]